MAATAAPVRRGRSLSAARILEVAAEVVAEDPAAFSMRRLADRLGVTTMALYKWFDDRDTLLDALAERLLGAVTIEVPAHGSFEDRLVGLALSIRSCLTMHRSLLRVDGASRRLRSLMLRSTDESLRLMLEMGLDDDAAIDAFRVLFWTTVDFCVVIDAQGAMPAAHGDDDIAATLADADPTSMPTLAALRDRFTGVDVDAFFERTARIVALGIVTDAARR